jgi:hypothetical protein
MIEELPGFPKLSGRAWPEHSPPNHIVNLKCATATLCYVRVLILAPVVCTTLPASSYINQYFQRPIWLAVPCQIRKPCRYFCRLLRTSASSWAYSADHWQRLMYRGASVLLVYRGLDLLFQLESRVPINDEGQKSPALPPNPSRHLRYPCWRAFYHSHDVNE